MYEHALTFEYHANLGIFVNLSILLIKQLPFIVLQAWSYDPRGPELLSPLASPAQGSRGVPRADCSTPPTGAELRPAPILAQVQGTLDNQYNPKLLPWRDAGFCLILEMQYPVLLPDLLTWVHFPAPGLIPFPEFINLMN